MKSSMTIHMGAIRDYLSRKFPDHFREILKAKDTVDTQRIIKRSRADDPLIQHLKHPEFSFQALEAGKPRSNI